MSSTSPGTDRSNHTLTLAVLSLAGLAYAVLGASAVDSSLYLLPAALMMGALGMAAGRVARRFGSKLALIVGAGVAAVAFAFAALVHGDGPRRHRAARARALAERLVGDAAGLGPGPGVKRRVMRDYVRAS